MKNLEQLVVLDFCDSSVHIYNINSDYEPEDMGGLIESLGHHVSNCQWMFGENTTIEFHPEIIDENTINDRK